MTRRPRSKDKDDPLSLDRSYKQPAVDIWRYPSPRFRTHEEPIGVVVSDELEPAPEVLFSVPPGAGAKRDTE